ncbi:MAG: polysaccharide biosynthesis tyrosine autokinase [Chthoniobacterales bacterium]
MQIQHSSNEGDSGEVKLHLLDYWRVIRVRLPLIILVFLLVVITAGVSTYLTPRQYQSSVTMQVKEDNNNMQIFNGQGVRQADPRFSSTQFQIIQRKEILYPVVDSMKLLQKWDLRSRDIAYLKLRSMLSISEVRNTDLIQISVLDRDRQEAADLANTIALEYQKKRIDEQQSWVARSLVQLEDEVIKQRKKVEELRDRMTRIRVEGKIYDLNPESVEDPRQAEEAILQNVESQVNDSRIKVATLRSKQQQIQAMTDEQIMRSLKTFEMDDATITQILPQYEASVSEEARMLNSGLGPNHPTVLSLQARKKVFSQQLKDQITVLRKSLGANLEISEKSLEAMEQKLGEARSGQLEAKSKALSYQEAKNEYLKAKRILETAETRYSTEAMQRTMPQSPATIWEKAEVSDFPAKPRVAQNMLIAVAVGLALGIGLAFLIEYLDTSVKTMQDIEAALGVPVLAVIPKDVAVLKDAPADCPDAEGYRIMRTNIEFNRKSPDANTLTLVSGGVGEGKSTSLNNLAFTFAKGGYRTLIVDADLRRPSQHRFFGASNERGLTDFLTADIALDPLILSTDVENLSFLPSGRLPIDAAGILNSQRMIDLIQQVKGRYDMVFFDSPPILGVSDASVIASSVDMTLVVVQHRRFPRAMLQRVKQGLTNVGARIVGCVLNNTDIRHDEYYEYYTSYYQYYSPQHSSNRKEGENSGNELEKGQKHSKVVTSNDDEGDY